MNAFPATNPIVLSAIILAGGKGTRLLSLDLKIHKSLITVCNIPFIDLLCEYLLPLVSSIVVVGNKSVVKHIRNNFDRKKVIAIVGTDRGTSKDFFLGAQHKNADAFLCWNSDTYVEIDINQLIN